MHRALPKMLLARWLPPTKYAQFNKTIGGLNQLLGKGKTKERKLMLEIQNSMEHKNIISRLMMKG
jgi:hypothetical protein